MAHDVEWHRAYGLLEQAEDTARIAHRSARGAAKKAAAMDVLRAAGKARWDMEMSVTTIKDEARG